MELIGIDGSTLTALFLVVRKEGQPHFPSALGEVIKRYGFVGFPTKVEELESNKVSLRQGKFNDAGIETFDIYRDGVVISARAPTDVLDAFLADVCEWIGAEIGLKRVETHAINRMYESTLFVRSDAKLLGLLDGLRPTQDLIAKGLKEASGLEAVFEPFAIALAADHARIPSMKPVAFRVERRVGVAFDTNYYASVAPLRTADHLKVLEQLEKLAMRG